MKLTTSSSRFGALLQQFFVERLMQQQRASARTIASYRDCFRLLLSFAEHQLGKRPAEIAVGDLTHRLFYPF
jgi:site-specific recombinase XerD